MSSGSREKQSETRTNMVRPICHVVHFVKTTRLTILITQMKQTVDKMDLKPKSTICHNSNLND